MTKFLRAIFGILWIGSANAVIAQSTLPTSVPSLINFQTDSGEIKKILIPGEDWKVAADGLRSTDGPAVNSKGDVFFSDGRSGNILKIGSDGQVATFAVNSHRAAGQAFGPDGKLYSLADATDQVIAYDPDGKATVFAQGIHGNDISIAANGDMYVTNSPNTTTGDLGKLWFISPAGEKKIIDTGLKFYNGVALSPDQATLYCGDYRSHWIYSYHVESGGVLTSKKQFADLYVPPGAIDSAADGLRADTDGRLYVTTRSGIQICDITGKVIGILATPNGRVSNLTFGGANLDMIYATCGDKIYARKVQTKGSLSNQAPTRPPSPHP